MRSLTEKEKLINEAVSLVKLLQLPTNVVKGPEGR